MSRNQQGMTIVELLVVMVMTSFFVSLILYFGMQYWRYSAAMESDLSTFVARLNAQDNIRETLGTASGLINQNSLPDSNTLASDPIYGANYWEALHATPLNIPIGSAGSVTPIVYFKRISTTTDNAVAMNGLQPYEDEYIMYLDSDSRELRLRTLANPNVANNKAQTSCPPQSASAACPADKVLLENTDALDTKYFSRSGIEIDYYSITDIDTGLPIGPDYPEVEAVELTLHTRAKPLFQRSDSTINATIVRVALRNL